MAKSSLVKGNPLRRFKEWSYSITDIFDTSSGHDHDGANSKSIAGATVVYGEAGDMAANGTSTANAAGVSNDLSRADHVHKIGEHDHSGATKGGNITDTAFSADAFGADATGRAPFADGWLSTAKMADGILSADATGRAKMAAGFVSADATGRAFFAANFFGAGDATSRAIFQDDFMDSTFCTDKIADGAIPSTKINFSFGVAGDLAEINPDDAASAGSESTVARIDHQHSFPCGAPVDGSLAAANAEGTATSAARQDHAHRAMLADGVELEFGTGYDAVIGWQTGDASNHTLVIGLADANQALHITDKSAINTDWAIGADTHPTLYIHSDTTPATDHLKMYHDATDGFIDSVGGNLVLMTAGVEHVSLNSGETVFNDGSADIDFKVESNGVEFMLQIDGGLDVIGIGATGAAAKFVGVSSTARTLGSAAEYAAMHIEPAGAVTTAGDASTSDYIASLYLAEPNITNGGGDTITVAATLYVKDAPSEGAANHAIYVAAGTSSFGGAVTLAAGASFADQSISGTTGNLTLTGAGYVSIGANPASAGYIRLSNNVDIAARNAANGADINMIKVNASDDVEVGADLQLGSNTLYGDSAANGDLTLAATSNGTETTSYIVASQMLDCTTGMVATHVKAGAIGDGETSQTDINGLMGIDSSNGRLYFRYGAAWHYCSQDAGFSFPAYESKCPICGEEILVGDAVVGVINEIQSDGAPHGLYCHSKCVGTKKSGIQLPNIQEAPKPTKKAKVQKSAQERKAVAA